jgi:hypothetical protein
MLESVNFYLEESFCDNIWKIKYLVDPDSFYYDHVNLFIDDMDNIFQIIIPAMSENNASYLAENLLFDL